MPGANDEAGVTDDRAADERGPLARAFWRALEERTRDPRLLDPAKRAEFVNRFREAMPTLLDEIAGDLRETLLDRAPAMLADHCRVRSEFGRTIARTWGQALNLFEVVLVICTEAGDEFNRRRWDTSARDGDDVFHALVRLHARSCLVASEVLTLLRAGYASGAHARWRTLHEITVAAWFIHEHGGDVGRRYLLHDDVQNYKAACAFQEHARALGEEPLTSEEFASVRARRDELVAEFGAEFGDDYGWAAAALGRRVNGFADIEKAVEFDHLRPYYKMASNAVHPNARGSFFDLGVGDDELLLLAGPSTRGLADPGIGACRSLFQSTVCILNHEVDVDEVVTLLVLQRLTPEVEEAFLAADREHDAEAARRRAAQNE